MKRKVALILLLLAVSLLLAGCASAEDAAEAILSLGDNLNKLWRDAFFVDVDLDTMRRYTRPLMLLIPFTTFLALLEARKTNIRGIIQWLGVTLMIGFVSIVIPALTRFGRFFLSEDLTLGTIATRLGWTSPALGDIPIMALAFAFTINIPVIHQIAEIWLLMVYAASILLTVVVRNTRPLAFMGASILGWFMFGWAFNVATGLIGGIPVISVGVITTESATNLLYAGGAAFAMFFFYLLIPGLVAAFVPTYSFEEEEDPALKAEKLEKRRLRDTLGEIIREIPGTIFGVGAAGFYAGKAATDETTPDGVYYQGGPSTKRLTDEGDVVEGEYRDVPPPLLPSGSSQGDDQNGDGNPDDAPPDEGREDSSNLRDSAGGNVDTEGESPGFTDQPSEDDDESKSELLREGAGKTEDTEEAEGNRSREPRLSTEGFVVGSAPIIMDESPSLDQADSLRESESSTVEDRPEKTDPTLKKGHRADWFGRAYIGTQTKVARILASVNPHFIPARATLEGLTGLLEGNRGLREETDEPSRESGNQPDTPTDEAEQSWASRLYIGVRSGKSSSQSGGKSTRLRGEVGDE